MRRAAWMLLLCLSVLAAGPLPGQEADPGATQARRHDQVAAWMAAGYEALEAWDYDRAREISAKLNDAAASPPADQKLQAKAAYFSGRLHFYTGEYEESRKDLERYEKLDQGNIHPEFTQFLGQVRFLTDLWQDRREIKSEHFLVRVKPGKDLLLVRPVLEAMEKAWPVLTHELGVTPPPPVLIELYPDFPAFSQATGLSETDVRTSGTVAVCKYMRFMVTSPRALAQGYDFQNSVAHEFVHYLIYLRNGRACPIWLHEGIAKYYEPRWRGDPGGTLPPISESLLATALRTDTLVSYERMNPTFAKLDSPRQGQLAFAEVATMVGYIIHTYGQDGLFRLLDELKTGNAYPVAVERALGKPFPQLFEDWKTYVRGQHYQEIPGFDVVELEIKSGESAGDEEEDAISEADIKENEAWKYVRLGDLLRDRGRIEPALIEYEKAKSLLPVSVRLLNKLGLAYTLAGNYAAALKPLEEAGAYFPGVVTTYVNLGRAYAGKGDFVKAIANYEHALTINPFDPTVYNTLLQLYEKTRQPDRLKDTQDRLALLEGKTENFHFMEERKP